MKPVTVSTDVAAPPAQVFEYLDTLANHEVFLDHYLGKWKFSGPASGVGAKAEALAKARSERLAPFLTRAFAKRINAKALRRLAKQLDG